MIIPLFAGNNNQESAFTDNNMSIEELSTSPVAETAQQQTNGFLTTFKNTSKEGEIVFSPIVSSSLTLAIHI